MYSVNIETRMCPVRRVRVGGISPSDVDETLRRRMPARRAHWVLAAEARCGSRRLPHMLERSVGLASKLIMESLARDYPAHFLACPSSAIAGTGSTGPLGPRPSNFIFRRRSRHLAAPRPLRLTSGRQAQGRLRRDGSGAKKTICGPRPGRGSRPRADWSFGTSTMGMTFQRVAWAGVPLAHEMACVRSSAENILLNFCDFGVSPVRRLETGPWTISTPRLDQRPARKITPKWGPDRTTVNPRRTAGDLGPLASGTAGPVAPARAKQRPIVFGHTLLTLISMRELANRFPKWGAAAALQPSCSKKLCISCPRRLQRA